MATLPFVWRSCRYARMAFHRHWSTPMESPSIFIRHRAGWNGASGPWYANSPGSLPYPPGARPLCPPPAHPSTPGPRPPHPGGWRTVNGAFRPDQSTELSQIVFHVSMPCVPGIATSILPGKIKKLSQVLDLITIWRWNSSRSEWHSFYQVLPEKCL